MFTHRYTRLPARATCHHPTRRRGHAPPPPSSTSSTSSARSPAGPSRQGPPAGPARGPGAEGEGGGPSSPGPSGPPQGGPGKVPPMCARCGHEILDRFLLKVSEQCWHVRCLACSVCHSPLSRHSSCFYRDRDVFCKLDYLRRFGRKCSRCGRHVQPSDWVRRARGLVFHLACFACAACKRQLATGEEFGLADGGRLLCRAHYRAFLQQQQGHQQQQQGAAPGQGQGTLGHFDRGARRPPPPTRRRGGARGGPHRGRGGGGAGEAGEASADLLHGRAAAGAVRPGQQPRRADPAEAGRPHRAQPQGHPGVVPEPPRQVPAERARAAGHAQRGPCVRRERRSRRRAADGCPACAPRGARLPLLASRLGRILRGHVRVQLWRRGQRPGPWGAHGEQHREPAPQGQGVQPAAQPGVHRQLTARRADDRAAGETGGQTDGQPGGHMDN
ncbi:uncharacterized protein LOC144724212 isoform X3 [Lampetra planeri]